MEFKDVAILITENCNSHCRMCCDSRGNVHGKTLSIDELHCVLENVRECESVSHVGITGGEPMLYPELVDEIFEFDFGRPVSISIKSNGFWGKDVDTARKTFERYHDKLSCVSLSYDEFHKEFIDLGSLKNVIALGKEYNVPTETVACCLKNTLTPGDILNELGEYAYLTTFYYQPVISTGAGACFADEDYIKLFDAQKDDLRCIESIKPVVLINPNLEVYPCCSQVIENTILKVGNLREASLPDIIEDIMCNYVFNTLFIEGFTPFKKILDMYHMDYPCNLASPCEFCEFLFKDEWFLNILKEIGYYENI